MKGIINSIGVTSIDGRVGDITLLGTTPAKPLADTSSAGTSNEASRADHQHQKPNTAEIGAVSFNPQTLTEEQKQQARTNMDAGMPVRCLNVTATTLGIEGRESITLAKSAISAKMIIIQPYDYSNYSTMILSGPFIDDRYWSAVSSSLGTSAPGLIRIKFYFKENGTKIYCKMIEGIGSDTTLSSIKIYRIFAIY